MINPILLSVNDFQIRFHGVLSALGFLVFFLIIKSNLKQSKIRFTRNELLDWLIITFTYGIVGARLSYVLLNKDHYFGIHSNWYEFAFIWKGGLELTGGILFSIFALWVLNRKKKPRLNEITDQVAGPLFIVLAFARVGNFINGEVYGGKTNLILGVTYKFGPASKYFTDTPIHPISLYEAVLAILGFFVLDYIRSSNYRAGFATASAFLWFSLLKLGLGLIRKDGILLLGYDQWIYVGLFGITISLAIIFSNRLYRKLPSPLDQFPSTRKWTV